VLSLTSEELLAALYPPLDTVVNLEIFFPKTETISTVNVKIIEFFKETLSSVPTGIPGLFYIKINQFNRATGEDFTKLTLVFLKKGMEKLIIDLRGNAGGPPLAAREIAGLFFPPQEELFYFQRKNRAQIMLKAPNFKEIFNGPIAILIDKGSGSASELFSGTLHDHGKAILIGEESAGKTFLKSLYHFEDESMLALVTSLAYLFNGKVFGTDGLKPDFMAPGDIDLFSFVNKCLDTYYEK